MGPIKKGQWASFIFWMLATVMQRQFSYFVSSELRTYGESVLETGALLECTMMAQCHQCSFEVSKTTLRSCHATHLVKLVSTQKDAWSRVITHKNGHKCCIYTTPPWEADRFTCRDAQRQLVSMGCRNWQRMDLKRRVKDGCKNGYQQNEKGRSAMEREQKRKGVWNKKWKFGKSCRNAPLHTKMNTVLKRLAKLSTYYSYCVTRETTSSTEGGTWLHL